MLLLFTLLPVELATGRSRMHTQKCKREREWRTSKVKLTKQVQHFECKKYAMGNLDILPSNLKMSTGEAWQVGFPNRTGTLLTP
jgi:hypothetical protein